MGISAYLLTAISSELTIDPDSKYSHISRGEWWDMAAFVSQYEKETCQVTRDTRGVSKFRETLGSFGIAVPKGRLDATERKDPRLTLDHILGIVVRTNHIPGAPLLSVETRSRAYILLKAEGLGIPIGRKGS